MKKVQVMFRMQNSDDGASVLGMILSYFGFYTSLDEIRKHIICSRNGSSLKQIADAGHYFHLDSEIKNISANDLGTIKCPFIAVVNKFKYVVVEKVTDKKVCIIDTTLGRKEQSRERFNSIFSNYIMTFVPDENFKKEGRPSYTYRILLDRLRPYHKGITLLAAFSLIFVVFDLLILNTEKRMIDEVMKNHNMTLFWVFTGLLLGFWFLQLVVGCFGRVFSFYISKKISANSISELYEKFLRLPLSFFEKISNGELMNRFRRNASLDQSLITVFVSEIIKLTSFVFYLILLFIYSPLFASILLVLESVSSFFLLRARKEISVLAQGAVSIESSMENVILKSVNSIDSIKSSGTESEIFKAWNASNDELKINNKKTARINSLITFLEMFKTSLISGTILFLGAYFIYKGFITIGILFSVQSVFNSLNSALLTYIKSFNEIDSLMVDSMRINDIKKRETIKEIPLSNNLIKGHLDGSLKVNNVSYRYNEGDALVLKNISFEIKPGEIVGLVGCSGAGKSTLMKLICSTYPLQEGTITYGGRTRQEIPDVIFHSSITSVDQEVSLFSDTIKENITMWDHTYEDFEIILAAKDAYIYNRILQNSNGFDDFTDFKGSCYSGGEKQRLELARALIIDSTLLVLDEFTSALDAETEYHVFQNIKNKHVSCLIAAHRLSTIKNCDKIIVMDNGEIVECGTHEELYRKKGKYYQLINI